MTTDSGLDVFVSYAHADNGIPLGAAFQQGWVTALASNLNEGPNVFKKRFFIDHQLRPGDDFNSDLLTKVEQSSLLVLLLSQNYIDSKWCGKELEHFIRSHSADSEKPHDVYVVELFPYESFTRVPPNIQMLRKRLIHAKFWHQPRNSSAPNLAGYPSALESGPEGRDHYWRVLNELRVALDARLRKVRTRPSQGAGTLQRESTAIDRSAGASMQKLGTVLLADTTEDLEAQRNAVKVALESEGIWVLPEGDYVGLTPLEFDAAIASDLERSDLFVQLLSATSGRKARAFEAPFPQLQFRRAVQAEVPILQWCERLPQTGQIGDPAHAELFETEFLRATHLADFKTMIVERLCAETQRQEHPADQAKPGRAVPRPPNRLVFVDDFASDPGLSEQLRAIIRAQGCDVRSLPPSAPLGTNGIDIKELLRPCRAGLTIYTDRTKYAGAYNRLVFFLNQVADGHLPVASWGVYLKQGTVVSEFGIESDEVVPIDEQGLPNFLRGL